MLKRNRVSMMICAAFCAVLLTACGQTKTAEQKDPTREVVSVKVAEAILADTSTDENAVQSLRDNYDSSTQQLVQYTCYVIPKDLPETRVAFGFIAVTTTGENPTFQYVSKPYGKLDDSPENYQFDAAALSASITGGQTIQLVCDGTVEQYKNTSDKDDENHAPEARATVEVNTVVDLSKTPPTK